MVLLAILTGISYAQSSYAQPSYAQPGYAQPGYAQPMPPDRASSPDLADPESSEGRRMHKEDLPPMGVPVEMIVGGGGFALQNNETHLLRLNVVRLSPLEPEQIRDLLVSNKSIEEIRDAIKAEEGQSLYRGNMKLDDVVYPLTNIRVRPSGDNATVVDADLALPGSGPTDQTSVVGHIMATVYLSKGGWIGEGQLNVNSTAQKGSYHVLLDMVGHSHAKIFVTKRESQGSEERGVKK